MAALTQTQSVSPLSFSEALVGGTVCGKSARTDLWGSGEVTIRSTRTISTLTRARANSSSLLGTLGHSSHSELKLTQAHSELQLTPAHSIQGPHQFLLDGIRHGSVSGAIRTRLDLRLVLLAAIGRLLFGLSSLR